MGMVSSSAWRVINRPAGTVADLPLVVVHLGVAFTGDDAGPMSR
jgi:hypothetical protein